MGRGYCFSPTSRIRDVRDAPVIGMTELEGDDSPKITVFPNNSQICLGSSVGEIARRSVLLISP